MALSERDHAGLPANMHLIYDYMSAAGDSRWFLPPQWYGAPLTNNPGFTTTAPEAVIRKASMLEGPAARARGNHDGRAGSENQDGHAHR